VRPDRITVTFVDDQISGSARLLWDEAPNACEQVLGILPIEVEAVHAIYSGSEIALEVRDLPQFELENPTTNAQPGDIACVYLPAEDYYGIDEDLPEILWLYDSDARPGMFEGPVPISVFARFDDLAPIAAASMAMRTAGAKRVRIEAATD
jgi:hypothetical protein